MKKIFSSSASTGGFTLPELIITVAIMSILTLIAMASYDVVRSGARYSQVKADMDAIGQAAYTDFTSNNDWPPMSIGAGMPGAPSTMANQLKLWPKPPCPGWFYSWEDWSIFNIGNNSLAVTLRRTDGTLVFNYCIDITAGGNCYPGVDPAGFGGSPVDISVWPQSHITCNE